MKDNKVMQVANLHSNFLNNNVDNESTFSYLDTRSSSVKNQILEEFDLSGEYPIFGYICQRGDGATWVVDDAIRGDIKVLLVTDCNIHISLNDNTYIKESLVTANQDFLDSIAIAISSQDGNSSLLNGEGDGDDIFEFLNEICSVASLAPKSTSTSASSSSINGRNNYSYTEIKESEIIESSNNTCNKAVSVMDKKNIEYVIGIDLGHGETSAAICSMQWEDPDDKLDQAKDLEMEPNRKVVPSAIAITKDGKAKIGTASFDPNILKQATVHVCFKKKPTDINGEAEQIMIQFMREVYHKIRENNGGMLTDTNHLVYIATPSGWDKEAQQLYSEMAKKAGLPFGGITKESRAAFVKAQHDPTANLGRNIQKGAIVFDMGSSTLDFTYHNATMSNMIDNGYDCGASFVEKSMFKEIESHNDSIREFRSKYPDLVDYLLFEVRRAKEEIYFDTTRKYKKTINFDDFIDDEDLEDERLKLKYEPGELNEFLSQNGYIQTIRDAMKDYITKQIPGQNIYGVFLTGGASRMDFIKGLVSECWNVPEDKIFRDQDPSLTISEGVAEVARMDLRTADINKDLAPLFNEIDGGKIYDSFINVFGEDLYNTIVQGVNDVIIEWRDKAGCGTLNQLNWNIQKSVDESITLGRDNVGKYLEEAIISGTEMLTSKVDSIVAAYTTQGANISIPSIKDIAVMNDSAANINMDSVMKEVATSIEVESSNWAGMIAGAGIGVAVALILGGPLTWIIGGAAYLGKKFFGVQKSEAEKRNEAMCKSLEQNERIQIVISLSEKWDNITNSVHESVFNSLRGNSSARSCVTTAVNNLIAGYKEALTKSRIMVD